MLIPVIPTSLCNFITSNPYSGNFKNPFQSFNVKRCLMLLRAAYSHCLDKPWDMMALILSTIHCTNIQRNTAIQNQSLQKQWVSNNTLKEIIFKRNLYIIHINVIDVYCKTLSCPLFH